MVEVKQNSTSFEIEPLSYGQEVAIVVNGEIVQKFNIQMDKAKVSIYVNKLKSQYV